MDFQFLWKGIVLGFSIAAPVGPIGILCIRRTLQYGRLSGLFSGLGAAVADTLYGVIAACGLTLISDFILAKEVWLRLLGGLFLLYLGSRTFLSKKKPITDAPPHKTLLSDFFSTFLLTITNPMTILAYLAIFAALGIAEHHSTFSHASWLVTGVLFGSLFWWLILSEGITFFRKRVTDKAMTWINRMAGLTIAVFGCASILSILWLK